MLLLGLLLLAVTGTFTGLLIAQNLGAGSDYTVTMFGHELATMDSLAIFLAGIALTLVLVLGCLLASSGARRARRRAVELRVARATADRAVAAQAASATSVTPVADPTPTTLPTTGEPDLAAAAPVSRRRRGFVHRLGH